VKKNFLHRREMKIRRLYDLKNHRRRYAILSLTQSKILANRFLAPADCISAHSAGPEACSAVGCSADLWASQWAGANQAEACCFHRCCPGMHGQLDQQQKRQGLCRGQQTNHGPERNRHRNEMEISAIHRFPACVKSGQHRGLTIATSQN